jgi:hypothetical protein
MCDYSLMTFPNRLACEGEELAAHRFKCGSLGLVPARDLDEWRNARPKSGWPWLKTLFISAPDPKPAVCVPPGARLRLYDIDHKLRAEHGVNEEEDVVFTQLSADAGAYRDAISFRNGVTMLLQGLPEGQRVRVLWLGTAESAVDPENAFTLAIGSRTIGVL